MGEVNEYAGKLNQLQTEKLLHRNQDLWNQ